MERCVSSVAAACTAILCALLLSPATATGTATAVDEASIMNDLWQALCSAHRPAGKPPVSSRQPDSPASHHCAWRALTCNSGGHVTAIRLKLGEGATVPWANRTGTDARLGVAPPQARPATPACAARSGSRPGEVVWPATLAQLEWLEELQLEAETLKGPLLLPGFGNPGAFPRLQMLRLTALRVMHSSGAPQALTLTDISPGALPALQHLVIDLMFEVVALPPSWGSSPDTLPNLRTLTLCVLGVMALPTDWAAGFRQLSTLRIYRFRGPGRVAGTVYTPAVLAADMSTAAVPTAATLPEQWAAGFPLLKLLGLESLGLKGSIPSEWQEGGFPRIEIIYLSSNQLTGTLSPHLFNSHMHLTKLVVGGNKLTGSLPEDWSSANAVFLGLESNKLTGQAFPPAWLEPGALPSLLDLDLAGNTGLTGVLPPMLPWPHLALLSLAGTGVGGSIPASWCQSPCAPNFAVLSIHHTAVDPALPACIARDMPELRVQCTAIQSRDKTLVSFDAVGAFYICHRAAQPQRAAVVVGAAAAVFLAAAGAGAALRWRHMQRRRRASKQQQQLQHDLESLLRGQQRRRHSAAVHNASADEAAWASSFSSSSSSAAGSAPAHRGRLSALLRTELAHRAGASFPLVPPEALPAAMAHHLGQAAVRRQAQALELQHAGTSSPRAASTHAPSWTGSLLSFWSASPAASLPLASRQWGLPTDSLRLWAGELQFLVENGEPIELGEGSHAVVYWARIKGGGVDVAAKVVELPPGLDSSATWREVSLSRQCVHARVVRLYGVCTQGSFVIMAMQLMHGGSLRAALMDPRRSRRLAWKEGGRQVALDVAEALAYLHSLGIVHSDIKAANVLLSSDWRASISDLGMAQFLVRGASSHTYGFTSAYAAPEQLLGDVCTLEADCYSFGVLLAELFTQKLLNKRGSLQLPQAPADCPQEVLDLIQECLSADPRQRPTAAALLARLRAVPAGNGGTSTSGA